ncbi:alkaline phosphatase PhoX [Sphingomicrobium lutaoense]|uniref:Phosphatase n=1 Tax=Sphingomicrobium lutaoense TaxID=515949 RepID=A0A839YZ72_9SPHN|nr:alkaline phosphatase PhoX [Sphingomicrobium lutaoense]MBB3763067.1 hypothetical protein [Sphingomicrobium lutaoense]
MKMSRRAVIGTSAAAIAAAYGGLRLFYQPNIPTTNKGLTLKPDPRGIIDLPEGFTYHLISKTGETMADGLKLPGRPDGMACFAMPGDPKRVILTRNHEIPYDYPISAFGKGEALLDRFPRDKLYNLRPDGRPYHGGVTIAHYELGQPRVERQFLALGGTKINCAGGATPWGSWLSCEETTDIGRKPHGFVFEVPALAKGPVDPVPLKAMGRFTHEACAVDPDSGIVYMTEDQQAGLFYRFLPDVPSQLARGGKLQALAIEGMPGVDTGNVTAGLIEEGRDYRVRWIDLDNVEAPDDDLAERGHAAGAALFRRGEGMAYGHRPGARGDIFFNCTSGGAAEVGQVFRYRPAEEGGGSLQLFFESPGAGTLEYCDNLAVAPWGDLILCEDGVGDQYLRGLTPQGLVYDLARNAHGERSEFCGACFSPDGQVLFVNIQEPGFTLAIHGPWDRIRRA